MRLDLNSATMTQGKMLEKRANTVVRTYGDQLTGDILKKELDTIPLPAFKELFIKFINKAEKTVSGFLNSVNNKNKQIF